MIRFTGADLPVQAVCDVCNRSLDVGDEASARAFLDWHVCAQLTEEDWQGLCEAAQGFVGAPLGLWTWAMIADLAAGLPPRVRAAIWRGVAARDADMIIEDPIVATLVAAG